jgi:hypothetical protein
MKHSDLHEHFNATVQLMLDKSLTEHDIYGRLMSSGADEETAGHLTIFVPSIMTRMMLKETRFPDEYVEIIKDGTRIKRKLAENQLYKSIEIELSVLVQKGISSDEIISIASRSAEFNAANDLLKKRPEEKGKDIKFTPAYISFENLKEKNYTQHLP